MFGALETPRQMTETFVRADATQAGSRQPIVGTTWLHPRFTLGSVNRGDFWKHRRPLLAYWGTKEAPRFFRARFLKNDEDFSSALFFSVQHQGCVLAAVVLSTDHGDTHPKLDPIRDHQIHARNLRFALEFGGALGRATIGPAPTGGTAVLIQDDQLRLIFQPVADAFGSGRFRWESPDLTLARPLHAIAHQAEEPTAFDLRKLGEVFFCFTLCDWPYDAKQPPATAVQIARVPGRLHARWTVAGKTLDLRVPTSPDSFAAMNDSFQGQVA